jgi:hypothetical protein
MLQKYAQADFFPFIAARRIVEQVEHIIVKPERPALPAVSNDAIAPQSEEQSGSNHRKVYHVIANHPGDLRFSRNWVLYFGGVVWCVVFLGLAGLLRGACNRQKNAGAYKLKNVYDTAWPWVAGLGYLIPTALLLKTAPDARFFLPAVPFLLLPFCEWCGKLPFRRAIFYVLLPVGLVQAGLVYHKTYELRNVPYGVRDAIEFLAENMPDPPRVFMYPEGNYRLFPADHEWYLSYGLRDFWKGDNDLAVRDAAKRHDVGAVVIKKHLVAPLDSEMRQSGDIPPEFVADLRKDDRFVNVLENRDVVIFAVQKSD